MNKLVVNKSSQCACCGKTFKVKSESRVMYCKPACEKAHDLFKNTGGFTYAVS